MAPEMTFTAKDLISTLQNGALEQLEGDGHTIFEPSKYLEMGFPPEFVEELTETLESDGSAKGSIQDLKTGRMVTKMTGVYNLYFLRYLAYKIGAKQSEKMGRGFQARQLVTNITTYIDNLPTMDTGE